MGNRFYKFFAIMRQAMSNKQLVFTAPGNKKVERTLSLFREKGLIAGFSLDFDKKGYWLGYPKYKVYLKYNYIGVPVIKKLYCYKLTKTNYTKVNEEYPRINGSNFWLVYNKGVNLLTSFNLKNINNKLIAKIKV